MVTKFMGTQETVKMEEILPDKKMGSGMILVWKDPRGVVERTAASVVVGMGLTTTFSGDASEMYFTVRVLKEAIKLLGSDYDVMAEQEDKKQRMVQGILDSHKGAQAYA